MRDNKNIKKASKRKTGSISFRDSAARLTDDYQTEVMKVMGLRLSLFKIIRKGGKIEMTA